MNRITNRIEPVQIESLRRKSNRYNGSNRDLNPNRDWDLPITSPTCWFCIGGGGLDISPQINSPDISEIYIYILTRTRANILHAISVYKPLVFVTLLLRA